MRVCVNWFRFKAARVGARAEPSTPPQFSTPHVAPAPIPDDHRRGPRRGARKWLALREREGRLEHTRTIIYIYIYIYIIYIYIYDLSLSLYIYIYICMYVCVYIYIYTYPHLSLSIYIYICNILIYIYICINIDIMHILI